MMRLFFILCFKLTGWTIKGELPDLKKFVLIVAPHTSMMDFFVGIAARSIFRLKSNFLVKDSLFKVPLVGWFLHISGGYAVDRSKHTGLVDQAISLYNSKDQFILTIAPEGTRRLVTKWKTGFYWIAMQTRVPIVMVGFDYKRKFVEMRPPFYPTGNLEADMETMKAYFRTIKGKYPEKGVL